MANGFSKLNPGNLTIETESDIQRKWRRKQHRWTVTDTPVTRRSLKRMPQWHGADTGTEREIPTWRRRKLGEQEDV